MYITDLPKIPIEELDKRQLQKEFRELERKYNNTKIKLELLTTKINLLMKKK
jgi:hypothetical protein